MKDLRHQFICVGAARCGTTSLWKWLDRHPSVHMSRIKETNYFTRDLFGREGPGDREAIPDIRLPDLEHISSAHAGIVQDETTYRATLAGSEDQRCGEVSPSYLFYAGQAAARIRAFNPDCKIIILLREPVSRALSQHAIFTAAGRETLSLKDALRVEVSRLDRGWDYGRAYRDLGLYYEAVRTYLDIFGQDRVWIGLYDDLITRPQATFDAICSFLKLPSHLIDSGTKVHQSPLSTGPLLRLARTRPGSMVAHLISEPVRHWLRLQDRRLKLTFERYRQQEINQLHTFYAEDVAKLEQLLPALGIKAKWNY